jgi:hypothetical protein
MIIFFYIAIKVQLKYKSYNLIKEKGKFNESKL